MSRVLLDTHLLLWAVGDPGKRVGRRPQADRRWRGVRQRRLHLAQAKTEPLILLTNDAMLAGYGDTVEVVTDSTRRR